MPNREDYDKFLADVRKETGIEAMTADESGLVTIRVDDTYNVNLQFVEATGRVLCFVGVAELPTDSPKEIYHDLLAGGLFGKETAGGYFALETKSGLVVYNYFFDLDKVAEDVEEFVHAIEKILQLCDFWAKRIKAALSEPASRSEDESLIGEFFHGHHIVP